MNAAITALDVRREIAPFANDSIRVVYGVYDLATLFVTAIPANRPQEPTFAAAPPEIAETKHFS